MTMDYDPITLALKQAFRRRAIWWWRFTDHRRTDIVCRRLNVSPPGSYIRLSLYLPQGPDQ